MSFVSRPKIVPGLVEERRYQVAMAAGCLTASTLLVLPTGLGKTVVALYVSAEVLDRGKKVLLLAPTKPLVDQHYDFFSSHVRDAKTGAMNGNMLPAKRSKVMADNDLIVTTPQSVANDLDNGLYDLDGFGLVIYDEAHRGTGNYDYVTVAGHCLGILALGLTASPGSDIGKVEEVCDNLSFKRIDMRADDDPDVAPYVHDTYVNKMYVNMPQEILDVIAPLKGLLDDYFRELRNLHLVQPNWPVSTTHMLSIGELLQRRLKRGERSLTVYRGLTVQSICMKILHAVGLAETQGMTQLRAYMRGLNAEAEEAKGNKGGKELVSREEYGTAWKIVSETKAEHPKISKIMGLVSQLIANDPNSKVMVFAQYRDTCDVLISKLSMIEGAKVGKLIGQSKGGLKQKEQIEVLDRFRAGGYNVIVATSVGEEGLDIASTNAVIFYEPVPSEIRTIQRRGRTGRKNDGEVYVLIAKGTVDEVFENSSQKKEDLMRSRLEKLNCDLSHGGLRATEAGQMNLGLFGGGR
ncbi:MAG: DEAD/DEAH box helicase family protein [Candidatus Methanoplasma sp.]|jgi:Fanconi anemia group M protein|nr:DEAD/DEAH box helicase family protein [Candidatus Methanoplasma sp.]